MGCASGRQDVIPMNEAKTLELKTLNDRIDLLETRLAFQDETIETLNKAITEQWLKIDTLMRQLQALSERLQEAESHAPGAANEQPPHY